MKHLHRVNLDLSFMSPLGYKNTVTPVPPPTHTHTHTHALKHTLTHTHRIMKESRVFAMAHTKPPAFCGAYYN